MMNVNKFAFLACVCGLKMKIPPSYNKKQVVCPKCGKNNEIPLEQLAALSSIVKNNT